jgi:hypothetical protein
MLLFEHEHNYLFCVATRDIAFVYYGKVFYLVDRAARNSPELVWYMSEHRLDTPIEMDSLPAQPLATGKSVASREPALSRRDYIVGICLLLLVVFLWTTSNFVTQVRPASHH